MPAILQLVLAMTVLAGSAAIGSRAQAQEYPWCARYADDNGGTNCGFSSLEQCKAAVSGNGGSCDANPFYSQASSHPAVKSAKRAAKKN